MPFSDELRDETRDDQVTSDTFVNMKLVLVLTDKQLYAQSLCDFYAIYRTVEEAVVCWGDYPELAPLLALMENSSRRDAFETDLEFYVGSNWREITKPSFPAKEYCERVKLLSAEDPMLLIAYVHTMYLTLLAGGQVAERIVRKTLGLPEEEGVEVFQFRGIDYNRLRQRIKTVIDSLELDRSTKDAIVAEKLRCFQMNINIVKAIRVDWRRYQKLALVVAIAVMLLFAVLFY